MSEERGGCWPARVSCPALAELVGWAPPFVITPARPAVVGTAGNEDERRGGVSGRVVYYPPTATDQTRPTSPATTVVACQEAEQNRTEQRKVASLNQI